MNSRHTVFLSTFILLPTGIGATLFVPGIGFFCSLINVLLLIWFLWLSQSLVTLVWALAGGILSGALILLSKVYLMVGDTVGLGAYIIVSMVSSLILLFVLGHLCQQVQSKREPLPL